VLSSDFIADAFKDLDNLVSSMSGDASRIARLTSKAPDVNKRAVKLRKSSSRASGILRRLLEGNLMTAA